MKSGPVQTPRGPGGGGGWQLESLSRSQVSMLVRILLRAERSLMWKQTDKPPFRDVTINYFKGS
jgi:hypothetical protein